MIKRILALGVISIAAVFAQNAADAEEPRRRQPNPEPQRNGSFGPTT